MPNLSRAQARTECLIYARASTDRQAKSCADQLAVCREYAAESGWTVLGEFVDDGISGTLGRDRREGWDALLRRVEAGDLPGGVVLNWDIDRWSRDFHDGIIEAMHLQRRGIDLADTRDGIIEGQSIVGRVMLTLKLAGAEEYVRKLSRNVRRGMASRRAEGYWTSKPPFGYRIAPTPHGNSLVPEPAEAKIVREIYKRLDRGETLTGIMHDLNRRQVPTKTGALWTTATIKRIATGASYGGLLKSWETDTEIPGQIKTFVNRDLWQRVRGAQMTSRTSRRPARKYPLSGLICCAECGAVCWVRGGKRFVYECSRHVAGVCPNGARVPVLELEQGLLHWWRSLITKKHLEEIAREEVQAEYERALAAAQARAPLEAELADLDRQEQRLIELQLAGSSTELVARRIAGLQRRREQLRAETASMGRDVSPLPFQEAVRLARLALERVAGVRDLVPHLDSLEIDSEGLVKARAFGRETLLDIR